MFEKLKLLWHSLWFMSNLGREQRTLTGVEKVLSGLCFMGLFMYFALLSFVLSFVDLLYLLVPYTALYYVCFSVVDSITGRMKALSTLGYYSLVFLFVFMYANLAVTYLAFRLLAF